jgi:hypothetical protein
MLLDVLPHREDGAAYRGGFAAFVNAAGILIATTDAGHRPGERPDPQVWAGHAILARSASPGYREFKRSDSYLDEVACVIAIPG